MPLNVSNSRYLKENYQKKKTLPGIDRPLIGMRANSSTKAQTLCMQQPFAMYNGFKSSVELSNVCLREVNRRFNSFYLFSMAIQ
jgi:hypothetical protein